MQMKQTELFTKTQKNAPKDEISLNAQLLIKAGYIDKLMAGIYTILPLGQKVMQKIEQIIREEMDAVGGQEIFMPTLHGKKNWEATGRWDSLDVLFKLKAQEKDFALGPTHEEIVSPLAKKFISSYKDLPKMVYQFQNKFRNELRAKSGILRGREFIMKDLYSFHADEKDLDAFYEKSKMAYAKIFERIGIWEKTYLTFASGGTFSKYSHEFQTITDAGEDWIYICDHCRIAVNKEILEDTKHKCPECGNDKLKEEKAVEVGNIFKLMTKFSAPFDLDYTDEKGEKKPVVMGCYGIGLQRVMGTAVEVSHDDKGIIWPENIAPFKYHLLSIGRDEKTLDIYEKMIANGAEVLFDDRDASTGEKFADSDLLGVPYRLVVSEKSIKQGGIEMKKRSENKTEIITTDQLLKHK